MEDQRNTFEELNGSNCIDNYIDSDTPYIKYWEHPDYVGLTENGKPCYKKHYNDLDITYYYTICEDTIDYKSNSIIHLNIPSIYNKISLYSGPIEYSINTIPKSIVDYKECNNINSVMSKYNCCIKFKYVYAYLKKLFNV